MDLALIGYLMFLGVAFTITSILTKKFLIGVMVLLIFVVIGYILTFLPIAAIILSVIGLVGLISYYLFMRSDNTKE
jgi:hypothetical protein